VVVDPDTELKFLHQLPADLMWGVGPGTRARLVALGTVRSVPDEFRKLAEKDL
jgi:DNA polymerase IV